MVPLVSVSQDLGSANKLFGGADKPPATSSKKSVPKGRGKSVAGRASVPKKQSPRNVQNRDQKNSSPKRLAGTGTRPPRSNGVDTTSALYETLIAEGNSFRDERRYEDAEASYTKAASLQPRDWRAAFGLGGVFSDQQMWEQAEMHYRSALQLSPSEPSIYLALSYVLSQPVFVKDLAGRYAEAERLARKATELSPENALAFDQLGVAMEMRGFIGVETESAYRKAIQLDPGFAPAYAHLARLMRRRGAATEAKGLDMAAIQRATSVGFMVVVAESLHTEQRYRESEGLLRQALALDPSNPSGLMMLGRVLTLDGRFSEAEKILRRCLEICNRSTKPYIHLSVLHRREGKLGLAENALLQAMRFVTPMERFDLANHFEEVGKAYQRIGKPEEADRCFRQAQLLSSLR
jgi:Flp pilus assembly protein TadD